MVRGRPSPHLGPWGRSQGCGRDSRGARSGPRLLASQWLRDAASAQSLSAAAVAASSSSEMAARAASRARNAERRVVDDGRRRGLVLHGAGDQKPFRARTVDAATWASTVATASQASLAAAVASTHTFLTRSALMGAQRAMGGGLAGNDGSTVRDPEGCQAGGARVKGGVGVFVWGHFWRLTPACDFDPLFWCLHISVIAFFMNVTASHEF
ncbi:unnamed protein product [Miscanthus lutarioriparius]|uniref:Uncharacterized protein n=1 Tax=Miscanthus lutarioriparius TaxID=422564 RepID=A0A811NFP7_9POAL|nr:unnamed protein product [Miscanthus lutarioriparius]